MDIEKKRNQLFGKLEKIFDVMFYKFLQKYLEMCFTFVIER